MGTSLFRAPEVHLEILWNSDADIWSFGVTASLAQASRYLIENLMLT